MWPYSKYLIGGTLLFFATIWLAIWAIPDKNLHLIACDVGQGDAFLITRGDIQVLTDGGPSGKKLVDCLSRHLPFWDRTIEIVILTHPQIDHFGGLTEIFDRYKVDTFISPLALSSTSEYQVLEKKVGSSGAKRVRGVAGTRIRADLIYLDIVYPFEGFESVDLNEYSLVYKLKYANFKAVFLGDATPKIIPDILATGQIEQVDYIKVPHHGSRYGLTKNLLEATKPKVAVISAGKNNSYGHPHPETLTLLAEFRVKILRTDQMGNVEVVTDGEKLLRFIGGR